MAYCLCRKAVDGRRRARRGARGARRVAAVEGYDDNDMEADGDGDGDGDGMADVGADDDEIETDVADGEVLVELQSMNGVEEPKGCDSGSTLFASPQLEKLRQIYWPSEGGAGGETSSREQQLRASSAVRSLDWD